MIKPSLMGVMLFLATTVFAMHSEKLTVAAKKQADIPCALSISKKLNGQLIRYCVYFNIINGNMNYQPSLDTILLFANEIINEDKSPEASRLFYYMADLPNDYLHFSVTVKLDILAALEAL